MTASPAPGAVTVVVPTYEERENLEPLLRRLDAALGSRPREILIVDDASPDGTAAEVERLAAAYPGLRLVDNGERGGIGAALRRGYDLARHELIVSLDADLSFPPEDVPRLLEKLEAGADLVLGCRHAPEGAYDAAVPATRLKRLASRLVNAVSRRVLGLPARDLTANFRGLRRDAWRRLRTRETGNAMLIETAVEAARLGQRVEELPVAFRERRRGQSKLRLLREGRDAARLLARAGGAGAAAALALAAVAALDLALVWRYAASLPTADDWSALTARGLPSGATLDWLFARHIGHLTVFTKLQVHALHAFGGWDLRLHHLSNQLLWTAVVAALAALLRRACATPLAVLAPFLLLAFSFKTTYVTLAWVSTCHFALLFSFLATSRLFDERQRDRDLAWGAAAAVAAVFSYGAGLTYVLVLLAAFAAFKAKRAEPGRLAAVALAVGAAVALWTLPRSVRAPSAWAAPDAGLLAALFAGLTAHGFGWGAHPPVALGLALAAACAAAPLALARRGRPSAGTWALGATCAGLLATMLAMSAARSGHADPWVSLISLEGHYTTYACLLPAVLAAALHALLRPGRARAALLVGLWAFCAAGGVLSGHWSAAVFKVRAAMHAAQRHHLVELTRERAAPRDAPDRAFVSLLDAARSLALPFSRALDEDAARAPRAQAVELAAARAAALGPFVLMDEAGTTTRRRGRAIGHFTDSALLSLAPGADELRVMAPGAAPLTASDASRLLITPSTLGYARLPLYLPRRLAERWPAAPARVTPLPASPADDRPVYEGTALRAGLFGPRREGSWDAGKGRLLLCYRGSAEIRVGDQLLVSRPGRAVYLPRLLPGPVRVAPAPGGYAGVWFEALGSR